MHFFSLGHPFKAGAMHFDLPDPTVSADELLAGQHPGDRAVELFLDSGRKRYDFLGGTYVSLMLISDRFSATLAGAGVTGWAVYPVALHGRDGSRIGGYSGLSVPSRSAGCPGCDRIVEVPPAVPGGKTTYARVGPGIDETSWDGSEVFLFEGTHIVCITERVKDLIVSKRLTNVDLIDLDDYQTGYVPNPQVRSEP